MLMAARPTRRSGAAQLVCDDLGRGFGFRCGTFDGCVSISAVQWLCHATRPEHEPKRRVAKFFRGLRAVLAPGRRAVLQLYPEQPEHMDMLRSAALDAGFSGGLVVDYPWYSLPYTLASSALGLEHPASSGLVVIAHGPE